MRVLVQLTVLLPLPPPRPPPLLQLFIARYYEVYSGQPWRAMGHLMRALRLGPPLDIAYIVYAARRATDSEVRRLQARPSLGPAISSLSPHSCRPATTWTTRSRASASRRP